MINKNNKKNLSILSISIGNGGTERVISLLLKKLIEDYNVTLFLFYDIKKFDVPKEVNSIVLSKSRTLVKPFFFKLVDLIQFTITYNKLLKKSNIDFAISFLAFPNLINGVISIFNNKCTFIISERGFPSLNTTSRLSSLISKIFYPLLYNRCSKLFSNSFYINEDLKNNFGVTIPMSVIYNPLEIPASPIIPKFLLNDFRPFKIISLGAINTNKNHIMIINAIRKLSNEEISLSILGEGPLKNELKKDVIDMGLVDRIVFHGMIDDVGKYLIDHQCFVLSSYTEGFPNALLEALSFGLPCISTNCKSGPLEILNENVPVNIEIGEFVEVKFGILINTNDEIALSRALQFILDNPEKREYYSKMGLKRAKDFELNSIYQQFKSFIHS